MRAPVATTINDVKLYRFTGKLINGPDMRSLSTLRKIDVNCTWKLE